VSRACPLTAGRFAEDAGGRLVAGDPSTVLGRVSIDSRTLVAGDAFVAIQGPRFDGHAFLVAALERGASALVVHSAAALAGLDTGSRPVVLVDDTERALQDVARAVRRRSGARVVAITGSAGKTTTKELTAAVSEARFRTLRNRGNLNNHIGLPLSLLDLQEGYEVAVVELGMNHAGEIRRLVGIAEPDVRVWTNVGTAHIEYFGTEDAIAEAKAEVLEGAGAATTFVANADDPRVVGRASGFRGRVVTFGLEAAADVRATRIDDRGLDGMAARVSTPGGELDLSLAVAGRANLANALAAVAVGTVLGVGLEAMPAALAAARPAPHRGELLRLRDDVVLYDDTYNASPSALAQALEVVASDRSGRRRVALLGEMLELGAASVDLHRDSGRAVARAGVAALVTVGGPAARALGEAAVAAGVPAAQVTHCATSDEAADVARAIVRAGDLVFVKGSRSIRMERVVERLQREEGA
jgi:UDP-N-acetylmuramoyl-tripeptide--D-alanyl-D-alanine ligase